MLAREYFEQAREAQRSIDRRISSLESMCSREGLRAQRYDTIGKSLGIRDVMVQTDARMDPETQGQGHKPDSKHTDKGPLMFSAKRYFESARAAMREADAKRRMRELMRSREGVKGQGYEAVGGSGISDPMAATDARMDAERGMDAQIAALEAEVDEAVQVCRRVRAVDPTCYGGSMLELHYFGLLSWREAARSVGVSETSARDEARRAMRLIEDVGVRRMIDGWGQMELPV